MAKLNQAQEPSMEEILASIRRIISDDGDDAEADGRLGGPRQAISTAAIDALFGARPPAPAQQAAGEEPLPTFLRAEPQTHATIEAAAAQGARHFAPYPAEPAAAGHRPAEPARPDASRSVDPRASAGWPAMEQPMRAPLADPSVADPRLVDARLADPRFADPRFADSRVAGPRLAEPRLADTRSPDPARGHVEAEQRPRAVVSEPFLREALPPAVAARAAEAPFFPTQSQPLLREEPPVSEPAPRRAAAAAPADAPAAGLLSSATDAAVSASFGDLVQTMLGAQARTLEDLVRELLRPMLKAWLDINLPPLVERLVRDEIERLSRGR